MTNQVGTSGVVSVFLGSFPSRTAFNDYLAERHNDDTPGVATTCHLWRDLGVEWLDHDFQDAHYQGDGPVPVTELLSNPFSYIDSFRDELIAACSVLAIEKVNTGVFLYNFEYPGGRAFTSPYLQFVGCFQFSISTPDWFKQLLEE